MPRGIVRNKRVSGAFDLDVSIAVVQEDLEDRCIRIAKFEQHDSNHSRWQQHNIDALEKKSG
jgi:hypothetical protein